MFFLSFNKFYVILYVHVYWKFKVENPTNIETKQLTLQKL